MRRLFFHNWGLKLIALVLAFTIWWLIRQERAREELVPFPRQSPRSAHEVNLPE